MNTSPDAATPDSALAIDDMINAIRSPSLTPAITSGPERRPYHVGPDKIPFPFERSLTSASPSVVQLSSDTRLSSINPATSNEESPPKILSFIFENSSEDYDYEHPIPFNATEGWNLAQFFDCYARKSGKAVGSLSKLKISIAFGNQQTFVVERYAEARKWQVVKDRLESLYEKEIKRKPKKIIFDIWVEGC